jgi:hypothetical protein
MGFSLTMAPMSSMNDEATCLRLEKWLKKNSIQIEDAMNIVSDLNNFPFELDELPLDPYDADSAIADVVRHVEVGWPWWAIVVKEMEKTLGAQNVKATGFLQPWADAAIPGDFKNQHLIQFEAPNRKAGIAIKLLSFFTRTKATDDVMVMMDGSGTVVKNPHLASANRILAELENACEKWGLPSDELIARKLAEQMYEAEPESDADISRCYALIVRSFLRYAIPNNHIVWFIK